MKKILLYILLGIAMVFVIIQFIPNDLPVNNSDLSNDMVQIDIVPNDISAILHTSCYDCHSNQTVYPWYSKVAPVSWLIAKDTREGRDEMNFSEWGTLKKRKKIKFLKKIAEEVAEKKMPLNIYTVIHKDAKLTDNEINSLISWTKNKSKKILNGE